ncbi:MAG: hypothetical protein PHP08_04565, partial [Candidatus Dojkabacteria bacterium]|nr:hypothetical protein [Candidatus Dojkabacteria bacterium]
MYKHLTKEDWINNLRLPNEYKVDALIVNGTGKPEDAENIFKDVIRKNKHISNITNLQHSFFKKVIEFKLENKTVWFCTTYGGAFLSELTHIACILGSEKNFFVGSCGALQDNLETGDIIIPTYSYGDESSTRMYQKSNDNRHYSNEKLNKEIENLIDKKYKINIGSLVTCQAMLAETEEDIANWKEDGYLGVEMESSTFFAVSNHFNVPSTAIIHISDNLVKNELVGSEKYEEKR